MTSPGSRLSLRSTYPDQILRTCSQRPTPLMRRTKTSIISRISSKFASRFLPAKVAGFVNHLSLAVSYGRPLKVEMYQCQRRHTWDSGHVVWGPTRPPADTERPRGSAACRRRRSPRAHLSLIRRRRTARRPQLAPSSSQPPVTRPPSARPPTMTSVLQIPVLRLGWVAGLKWLVRDGSRLSDTQEAAVMSDVSKRPGVRQYGSDIWLDKWHTE